MGKTGGQRLLFKIHRRKGKALRNRDATGLKAFPFPCLRSGEIHFKDLKIVVRIAIGESIKPRAQDNILPGASRPRFTKMVFSKSATCGDKGTQRPRGR